MYIAVVQILHNDLSTLCSAAETNCAGYRACKLGLLGLMEKLSHVYKPCKIVLTVSKYCSFETQLAVKL